MSKKWYLALAAALTVLSGLPLLAQQQVKIIVSNQANMPVAGASVKVTVNYTVKSKSNAATLSSGSLSYSFASKGETQEQVVNLSSGQYMDSKVSVSARMKQAPGAQWKSAFSQDVTLSGGPVYSLVVGGSTAAGTLTLRIGSPDNVSASTSSAASSANSRKEGIRSALNSLTALEGPKAMIRDITEETNPQYFIEGGDLYELKKKKHNIKDEASADLFCNDGTSLFPGCLVYANSALRDGNGVPTNDFGVGRVVVSLDIDTGGKNAIECDNTRQGVQDAVRTLVRQAYQSGYQQPSRSIYRSENYTSSAKMAIDLGCDLSYAGAKLKVNTSTSNSSSKITHFEDLSMVYYTVHVDPKDNDVVNLFGSEVTGQMIKERCEKYGPITYVSSMTYGCRVYLFEEYEASSFKFNGSQNASFSGNSLSSKQDIVNNTKASTRRVFINGGPQSLGTGMIADTNKVNQVIKKVEAASGFALSSSNQGLPMGLKTTYVGSGSLCERVTNGQYTEISYIKHPKYVHAKVYIETDGDAGSRCKPKIIYKTLKISPKTGKIIERGIEHDPIEDKDGIACGARKLVYTWNREIELEKNEYIDGNVYFGVRTRAHSTSKKWTQSIEGYVDPVLCEGNIHIFVKGDLRSNTYIGGASPVGLINQTKGKK